MRWARLSAASNHDISFVSMEDQMKDRMFDTPIFVRNGSQPLEEVAGIDDALVFLYEWPKRRRGPIYETALRACQRAFEGRCSRPIARQAFASFARSVDILEDVSNPLPWMTGQAPGRGELQA